MTARIQYILCPVDFSSASPRALAQATALAGSYHAEVRALHVFTPPLGLSRVLPQYAGAMLDTGARADLIEQLDATVKPARERGIAARTTLREGDVVDEIDGMARRLPADLIVMGTHGRSGLERLVLGSVTEKTLRTAPCPVLTVPPAATDPDASGGVPFRHILCPLDFSGESRAALDYAVSLAQHLGGRITLLHVLEGFPEQEPRAHVHFTVPEFRRQMEAEARALLHEAVPAAPGDWCESDIITAGKPYREILRQAETQQSDLIVMGVRGRGAAHFGILGSTTDRVVREAACPVLTVRQGSQPSST